MGEQVAGAAGYGWLDGIRADLADKNYACQGVDIPACAVNAPHIRQRLYWVATNMANTNDTGLQRPERNGATDAQREPVGHSVERSGRNVAYTGGVGFERRPRERLLGGKTLQRGKTQSDVIDSVGLFWSKYIWLRGADQKIRRAPPSLQLLANGVPGRVGKLRAFGNAIVPQVAAEVITAYMETQCL